MPASKEKILKKNTVINEEIDKYLINEKDFIDDEQITSTIQNTINPDKSRIRDIIAKACSIERLEPEETASLLNVKNPELWDEIYAAAPKIKQTVYDSRIVTFAPLYISNLCVNNCLYCGFRSNNTLERKMLNKNEIRMEVENLLKTGHKRMILVSGEHPESGAEYIAESMKTIYDTQLMRNSHLTGIRRINLNVAPMSISDLKKIKEAGIGTYQVFQETYHHPTYAKAHPHGIKSNYRWRLYALHRAMDAGIDDVAIGALFGLYDWRFEVMGLLHHAIDLEKRYGIGPHTVSFPRLNPADGSFMSKNAPFKVDDDSFKKLVAVLRLSIPYSGMILTARESEKIRDEILMLGCTQTDASTKIGIGAYSNEDESEADRKEQFNLGDKRSLQKVMKEMAKKGIITSFCTAGYRCGRTGEKIMGMLKSGHEGKFCKLNAVLTFKEWIDDFGDSEIKELGEKLIQKEISEIENDEFYSKTKLGRTFKEYYDRIDKGERDLFI